MAALIRLLCKPHTGVEIILIKPTSKCVVMMADISKYQVQLRDKYLFTETAWKQFYPGTQCLRFVMSYCIDTAWISGICPYFWNLLYRMFMSKFKDYRMIQT